MAKGEDYIRLKAIGYYMTEFNNKHAVKSLKRVVTNFNKASEKILKEDKKLFKELAKL